MNDSNDIYFLLLDLQKTFITMQIKKQVKQIKKNKRRKSKPDKVCAKSWLYIGWQLIILFCYLYVPLLY